MCLSMLFHCSLHFQCCTREPQTQVSAPIVRNLYFRLCCLYFFFVLIIQVYKICQVCFFSHQNSLELSEPAQSIGPGLFSLQKNYLLLFNYCLCSICSVSSFQNAYQFYYAFPESVLQSLSYSSGFPSPYIFALDLPGPKLIVSSSK